MRVSDLRMQGAAAGVVVAAVALGLIAADETRDGDAPRKTTPQTTAAARGGGLVQAESLSLDPAKGQPFDDPQASGGKGLLIWADGAVTTPLAGPVDHPVIRVRGDQCAGAPSMRVRLNGEKIDARQVTSDRWTELRLDARSSKRQNVLSIAYYGDAGQPGCDRNLRLDWIAATASAVPGSDDETAANEPTPTPSPERTSPPAQAPQAETRPAASGLWVDPDSDAAQNARRLRAERSPDAAAVTTIARQPAALWLGEWSGDVATAARTALDGAARTHTEPVFTLYAIPDRDCGSYSAGGVDAGRYRALVRDLARAIGDRPAIVILEPDALAQSDCLTGAARAERFSLLRAATTQLAAGTGTRVYLDAGHSDWKSATDMAALLKQAGIDRARGFALNTSNYERTADEVAYGRQLSAAVGGKPFVVDTSRNGNGPQGDEWCNPAGRAIGHTPTLRTGLAGVDAFLWIKRPGESDGTCNGGPAAGQWWQQGAVALARGAR